MQHALWADAPVTTVIARTSRQPAVPHAVPPAAPHAAAQPPRNWIAVASAEHTRRGCAEPGAGYMQVCHGKAAPLQRMRAGDRVTYYAPAVTMGRRERVQAFVSIGTVREGAPYAVDMGNGFVPYRRDVAYLPAREAPIHPLLPYLKFVDDPARWGAKFRFGLFAISDHDMRLIARAMGAQEQSLHF